MSDINFSKLFEWKKVLEFVDVAWAEDCPMTTRSSCPRARRSATKVLIPSVTHQKLGPLTNTTYLLLSS